MMETLFAAIFGYAVIDVVLLIWDCLFWPVMVLAFVGLMFKTGL